MGVVLGRIELEQSLERGACRLVLARVEVRATERLEDRGLAGLRAVGALEDDRRLGVMPSVEQLLAPLEQLVGALRGRVVGAGLAVRPVFVVHAEMVARNRASRRQRSRYADRSTGFNRGESVMPGIRPRLAIGRPSISLMSPVKSIGLAPLM